MTSISKKSNYLLLNSSETEIILPLKKEFKKSKEQSVESPKPLNKIRTIGKRTGQERGLEDMKIAPNSTIRIGQDFLKLYDTESFEKKGILKIVEERKDEATERYIISNKTIRKIGIQNLHDNEADVVIPAFGSRTVDLVQLEQLDYRSWKAMNLIDVKQEDQESEELRSARWNFFIIWAVYGWLFIIIIKSSGLGSYFGEGAPLPFSIWWLWPGVALISAFVYFSVEVYKRKKLNIKKGFLHFLNFINKFFNRIVLFIWPMFVPVIIVLFFGGVLNVVSDAVEIWNNASKNDAQNFIELYRSISGIFSADLLLRLMQLVFIIILALVPGMLYFQYERRQIGTIRTQFIRNIMYLNPLIHTVDDAEIRYGSLVDEISVSTGENAKQFSILSSGRPILINTILVTLCWIFTIWPIGEVSDISKFELFNLLVPRENVISFAFLGAYFFGINLLFKRYARGDLSPKAYSHISIRILSSIIVVWIINIIFGDGLSAMGLSDSDNTVLGKGTLYAMAFGIGLIPETGLMLLRQLLESEKLKKYIPNFKAKHPITDLEGISLYDKARLIEEGVESVETLAHHNIVELMLRSGIPAARIVDLVDQAILYLHTTGIVENANTKGGGKDKSMRGIEILREEGIRTATDVLAVEKAVNAPGDDSIDQNGKNRRNPDSFYSMLDSSNKNTFRLQRVIDALKDDEWLVYVINWRCIGLCEKQIMTNPNELLEEAMEPETIYQNFNILHQKGN